MQTHLKILVGLAGLLSLCQCQQSGAGVPSYKAVPRLVPVQVRNPSRLHEISLDESEEGLVVAEGRNVRITTAAPIAPSYPYYTLQSAYAQPEPQVVKRIRVGSPAAVVQHQQYVSSATSPVQAPIIQLRQTVPAVATYKAQPQSHPLVYAQPQQQYAYIPQTQPVKVLKPVPQQQRPVLKVQKVTKAQRLEDEEEEYPSDPNPQYNFAFDVKDDDFTNYQNRQETRDGGVIKGSYSVVDPDGYVRTVTYEASPKGGFQAKVTREPTDVKIKFPVPTLAPEQETGKQQPQYAYAAAIPKRAPHRLLLPQYAQ